MEKTISFNNRQARRAVTLLKAAREIVKKSDEAQSPVAFWDNADCDGMCLLDDISAFLEDAGVK